MNRYYRHITLNFHKSLAQRTFDQDDLALFLIAIRPYAIPEGVLREIADFVAHPEKDRGLLKDAVKDIHKPLSQYFAKFLIAGPDEWNEPIFSGLCRPQELLDELNSIFKMAGAEEIGVNPNAREFREFIFSLVFLLSTFKLTYRDQLLKFHARYSFDLTLCTTLRSSVNPQVQFVLPILQLDSVWPDCPLMPVPASLKLDYHIARRFSNGEIAAISLDSDKDEHGYSISRYSRGSIWGLSHSIAADS